MVPASPDDAEFIEAAVQGALERTERIVNATVAMLDKTHGAGYAKDHPDVMIALARLTAEAVEQDRANASLALNPLYMEDE